MKLKSIFSIGLMLGMVARPVAAHSWQNGVHAEGYKTWRETCQEQNGYEVIEIETADNLKKENVDLVNKIEQELQNKKVSCYKRESGFLEVDFI